MNKTLAEGNIKTTINKQNLTKLNSLYTTKLTVD